MLLKRKIELEGGGAGSRGDVDWGSNGVGSDAPVAEAETLAAPAEAGSNFSRWKKALGADNRKVTLDVSYECRAERGLGGHMGRPSWHKMREHLKVLTSSASGPRISVRARWLSVVHSDDNPSSQDFFCLRSACPGLHSVMSPAITPRASQRHVLPST